MRGRQTWASDTAAGKREAGRRAARDRDPCGGAAAVEFALIAPILFTLLAGVAEFGFAMYDQMRITSGARAGAQFAVIDTTNAANAAGILQSIVNDTGKTAAQLAVTSPMSCECNGAVVNCAGGVCAGGVAPEVYVTVNVAFQHQLVFPWPGVPNPIRMTGVSRLRLR